jgi:hypothetical protein
MHLSIRSLLLQHQVRENNSIIHAKVQQRNLFDVAKTLNSSPNDKLVLMIFDALKRSLKILKTQDENILKYATILKTKFGLRVEKL